MLYKKLSRVFIFFCFFCFELCHSIPCDNFSYIVVDGDTDKVLEQHMAHRFWQPASLTKKMTLYLLFEALQKKHISLQSLFYVSHRAQNQLPCKLGLRAKTYITVCDLIKALCVKSANDGAVVIAEGLCGSVENFVSLMNQKARTLGMQRTHFVNPTGWKHAKQQSTPYDMYLLAQALFSDFPEFCHYFQMQEFVYGGKRYNNHNRLLKTVPGMLGLKTGYVDPSGYCLSTATQRIVHNQKRRLFVVVLGGKTATSRDQKVRTLIEKHFSLLNCKAHAEGNLYKLRLASQKMPMEKPLKSQRNLNNHRYPSNIVAKYPHLFGNKQLKKNQCTVKREKFSDPFDILDDANPGPSLYSVKKISNKNQRIRQKNSTSQFQMKNNVLVKTTQKISRFPAPHLKKHSHLKRKKRGVSHINYTINVNRVPKPQTHVVPNGWSSPS